MEKYIKTPITETTTRDLKTGDYVYLTGTIYVARDAAHKRMAEALAKGEELPINIRDATIYYMGHLSGTRRTAHRLRRAIPPHPAWINTLRRFWISDKKP